MGDWRKKFKNRKGFTIVTYGPCFFGDNLRVNTWVKALQEYFDANGYNASIYIRGMGAKNSNWGVKKLENRVLSLKPDLVLMGFGGTDSKKKGGVSLDKSEDNIMIMCDQLVKFGTGVVLIATLPNTLKGRDQVIRKYFVMQEKVACKKGVDFINLCSVFDNLEVNNPRIFNLSLTNDRGHLTRYGSENVVFPIFKTFFEK